MEIINVGTTPNDNTGDTLRNAFIKVNENFDELQNLLGDKVDLTIYTNQVNSILNDLDDKSDIGHTHTINQITGLQNSLNNLTPLITFNSQISSINSNIAEINLILDQAGTILEAPINGKIYGRKNAGWTEITAEAQVQSDWNVTGTTSPAFIKNKPDLTLFQLKSEKNTSGGYAGLVDGKLDINQIPDAILGQMQYQGTFFIPEFNPPNPITTKGYYWINVGGGDFYPDPDNQPTYFISFNEGDWLVSNGVDGFAKIDNSDAITSFNTRTGAIVLSIDDIKDADVNGDLVYKSFENLVVDIDGNNLGADFANKAIKLTDNDVDYLWLNAGLIRLNNNIDLGEGFQLNRAVGGGIAYFGGLSETSKWATRLTRDTFDNNHLTTPYWNVDNGNNIFAYSRTDAGTSNPIYSAASIKTLNWSINNNGSIQAGFDTDYTTPIEGSYVITRDTFEFGMYKALDLFPFIETGEYFRQSSLIKGEYLDDEGIIYLRNVNDYSIATLKPTTLELKSRTTTSASSILSLDSSNSNDFLVFGTKNEDTNTFTNLFNIGQSGITSTINGTFNITNNVVTSRMNFGLISGAASTGSEIFGSYFSVFGNNITDATQRGSAEFVFDTRNSGTSGFKVTSFDGTNWKREFVVSSTGNIGIGTSTPDQAITLVRDNVGSTFINTVYETTQNFYPPAFVGRKARGTAASPTAIQSGDFLFLLGGRGYNGSAFPTGSNGTIVIGASGTFSTTSTPTYLGIELTASGSVTRREVARFSADGNLGIGITAPTALLHAFGSMAVPIVAERNTQANTTFQAKNSAFSVWIGQDGAGNFGVSRTSADLGNFSDMLKIDRISGKLNLRTGSSTSVGSITLTGGVATISNTAVTANSLIFIQNVNRNTSSATGNYNYTIVSGTSFTITSYKHNSPANVETGDVSTVNYWIIN